MSSARCGFVIALCCRVQRWIIIVMPSQLMDMRLAEALKATVAFC